ncbi:uncharacterized protein PpBr36_10048 [Pyricularia pennisetigena]|uniref:uncharacterized protein n=1 Tax=Pyricularia pennisetigena TaxID=1578925 RepID=UPI001152646F|nr:uncharacterized protein PpBr36_10048 [Pyricularia pennisetigena]TLS22472.1 hypothetical protein PpBr36_10048 [Pyricularia pennisetigena]
MGCEPMLHEKKPAPVSRAASATASERSTSGAMRVLLASMPSLAPHTPLSVMDVSSGASSRPGSWISAFTMDSDCGLVRLRRNEAAAIFSSPSGSLGASARCVAVGLGLASVTGVGSWWYCGCCCCCCAASLLFSMVTMGLLLLIWKAVLRRGAAGTAGKAERWMVACAAMAFPSLAGGAFSRAHLEHGRSLSQASRLRKHASHALGFWPRFARGGSALAPLRGQWRLPRGDAGKRVCKDQDWGHRRGERRKRRKKKGILSVRRINKNMKRGGMEVRNKNVIRQIESMRT